MADKIRQVSNEADGASALAHEIDNQNNLTTTGAKILSIKKAGVEKFAISAEGIVLNSGFEVVVEPGEGWAGIRTALNAAKTAGGGVVRLLEGTYAFDDYININDNLTGHNIILEGMGDGTIIDISQQTTSFGVALLFSAANSQNFRPISNVTKGDTSIFLTTTSQAAQFLAGDQVILHGLDADPLVLDDTEVHTIKTDGNISNGEVQLVEPIVTTMTNPTATRSRGHNLIIRNMKFTQSGIGYTNHIGVININNAVNCLIENVTFEHANNNTMISLGNCVNAIIKDCRFFDHQGNSTSTSQFVFCQGLTIKNCIYRNIMIAAGGNNAAIKLSSSTCDANIENNYIINSGADGMRIGTIDRSRRINIIGNRIIDWGASYGINIQGENRDIIIANNILEGVSGLGAAIEMGNTTAVQIHNNIIRDCAQGIRTQGGDDLSITGNKFFRVKNFSAVSLQYMSGASDILVDGNDFFDCGGTGGAGIVIQTTNTVVTGNTLNGANNAITGIRIYTASSNNVVAAGNTTLNHITQGILVEAAAGNVLLVGNNCNGDGITIQNTTTTEGLNKA